MTRKARPEILIGETYKLRSEYGHYYITINSLDGLPIEVRMQVGRSGTVIRNLNENLGICLSRLLQVTPPEAMVEFLEDNFRGIKGDDDVIYEGKPYPSIFDFISHKLVEKLKSETKITTDFKTNDHLGKP
jgi:hypothetical protein